MNVHENRKMQLPYIVILPVIGVLLNILGAHLAAALSLPLYLDCFGTMLAAALGGYIPGIVVGYCSNLINSTVNPSNMYFAVNSVLIAFFTAYFTKKGYFRRVGGCITAGITFTLLGGGLGTVISWLLYGVDMSAAASTPLSLYLVEHGILPAFWANFVSAMVLDLADKLLQVLLLVILLRLMPESVKRRFWLHGWKQTPLSDMERKDTQRIRTRGTSLKSKIVLLIGVATIFMATATTGISFLLYHRATIEDHTRIGIGVSALAASVVNGDRVEEYLAKGESVPGYAETEQALSLIRESSPDIEYVYVYSIRQDGCHVVFDLDTEDLQGEEPGTVIPFDESFANLVPNLLAGEEIDPIITDDTYGWLLTSYWPVRDSSGRTVCYAAADINMGDVRTGEISFITRVITLFFGFFIIIIAIGLWVAEYSLLLPINTMTASAVRFASDFERERGESVENFRKLDIRTGDEIENLYNSFASTMASAVDYMDDAQTKSASLTKMQNGLILVLADLVESRDKCTGDHVRKTAAYTRIILRSLRKQPGFGETVTDAYIDDVGNSAPLHDIGKIAVPDSVLNKPGKLTDEEFEIMKKHTTAGHDIITRAMALVSDSGYLAEAMNLATYHHEKWNGTGYPKGLEGEEIPLSARVMAVADVFDALVSRRSYKEPFTVEKAVSIIEEGAGSHFDPRVVKAFMDAMDEIREVYKTNMNEVNVQ